MPPWQGSGLTKPIAHWQASFVLSESRSSPANALETVAVASPETGLRELVRCERSARASGQGGTGRFGNRS